jgi:Tfp pilus assembly protein PilN
MSDLMLHGKLNMPLPDEPQDCDVITWVQFKAAAKEASNRIEELEERLKAATDDAKEAEAYAEELERGRDHIREQRNFAQKQVVKAEAKLAKAVEALDALADCVDEGCYCSEIQMATAMDNARTTLAELKGEKDE